LLLSYDDFVFVTYFKVEESNEFSDHSALTIHIERKPTPTRPRDAESSPEQRIKWDDSRINLFRAGLLNKRIEFDTLTNTVNYQNIDNTVTLFTNLINENAMKVFGCTKNYRHNYNTGNKQANKKAKWFDQSCYNARKEFKKKRNLFMRNKTDENRKQFIDEKKKYNRLKKLKKTKSSNDEKFKLTTLAKKEPKQFWKKIKKQYKTKSEESENLTTLEMYNHFKELLQGNQNVDQTFDVPQNNIDDLDKTITEEELKKSSYVTE
jgi:hypothetical protein